MFGDFLTLAADQIINHIAKFRWMYNDQVRLPLVIRTPMGGRRGYGPTHSQSLEKHFLGVPGLRVLAPCALGNPGALLQAAILQDDDPVLFIENKLLYLQPIQDQVSLSEFELSQHTLLALQTLDAALDPANYAPAYTLSIRGAPAAHLTLATYGYALELARQAALRLAYEHEIFMEIVALTQLSPFVIAPVLASVERTRRLLTLEEGSISLGWGAEILAQTSAAMGGHLQQAARLAARDLPVPASGPLEAQVLPGVEDILRLAQMMV
jgi:pyruvate/2-oxoglutarate/acetoin dehydrogenase E1 component